MFQNKLAVTLTILLLVLATSIVYLKSQKPQDDIHYHAGFQVYTDGQLQDFSDLKYMSLSPCDLTDHKKTAQELQHEKAHLHDGNGDVVHVHAEGAKWRDLFTNIKYPLDDTQPVVGFVNGEKIADILNYSINPFDSVVIFVGDAVDAESLGANRVTRDRIVEVERQSEDCGN